MVPSSMRRVVTLGVDGTIAAACSARWCEVITTRAPQSSTMYASSPLVNRDDAAVYTAPA